MTNQTPGLIEAATVTRSPAVTASDYWIDLMLVMAMADAPVASFAISGTNAADYQIVTGTWLQATSAMATDHSVTVTATPTGGGAAVSATLTIRKAVRTFAVRPGGDDTAAGTVALPWAHHPDDPAAMSNAAAYVAAAGDIILFRAGDTYRGQILTDATSSGTSGSPVVWSGMAWGQGRAVLSGAQPLTGIVACTTLNAAGNVNQASLKQVTGLGSLADAQFVRVDENPLGIARWPTPADPNDLFLTNTDTMRTIAFTAFSDGCAGFEIASLSAVGTAATLSTTLPHGLANSDSVYLAGNLPATYNGNFVVTVVDPYTVTFTLGSAGAAVTTLGTLLSPRFSVTDATLGTRFGSVSPVGASVIFYSNANTLARGTASAWDSGTSTLTVTRSTSNAIVYQTAGNTYYALYNHPFLITAAGQYSLTLDNTGVVFWPPAVGTVYEYAVRDSAIGTGAQNYITAEGFVIQDYAAGISASSFCVGGQGISPVRTGHTYQFNTLQRLNYFSKIGAIGFGGSGEMVGLKVIGNTIQNNPACGGIRLSIKASDFEFSRNDISGTAYTCMYASSTGAAESMAYIRGNKVHAVHGQHADGIALYVSSRHIAIQHNEILGVVLPITTQTAVNGSTTANPGPAQAYEKDLVYEGNIFLYYNLIGEVTVNGAVNIVDFRRNVMAPYPGAQSYVASMGAYAAARGVTVCDNVLAGVITSLTAEPSNDTYGNLDIGWTPVGTGSNARSASTAVLGAGNTLDTAARYSPADDTPAALQTALTTAQKTALGYGRIGRYGWSDGALKTLSMRADRAIANGNPGALIGVVRGLSSNTTISLVSDFGGRFAVVSGRLRVGATAITGSDAASYAVQVVEQIPGGASNTTTLTVLNAVGYSFAGGSTFGGTFTLSIARNMTFAGGTTTGGTFSLGLESPLSFSGGSTFGGVFVATTTRPISFNGVASFGGNFDLMELASSPPPFVGFRMFRGCGKPANFAVKVPLWLS